MARFVIARIVTPEKSGAWPRFGCRDCIRGSQYAKIRTFPQAGVHRDPSIRAGALRAGYYSMRLGFIGLGQMGSAMARRLLDAGHELIVWNRSAVAAELLVGRGARRARDPAEALAAEVVISMLADDAAL